MSLIITDAGIAAAIRAGDLGIEYKITHISIGSEGYVPEPTQTELRNELQKKAITRGALVAPGQLHFETVWDGVEEFEGKELGYWLEDGTLFAVDSRDGDIITYKRKNTVVTEACELNLSASTISNITVELLGSPYATEAVAGIAKIATTEFITQGTNDETIVTPKKLNEGLNAHKYEDDPHSQYLLKVAHEADKEEQKENLLQFAIFPEVLSDDGKLLIELIGTTLIIQSEQTLRFRGWFDIDVSNYDALDLQFEIDLTKTYHLRFSLEKGFRVLDLSDVSYNPELLDHWSESFDSTFDDALLAVIEEGVVTTYINIPEIPKGIFAYSETVESYAIIATNVEVLTLSTINNYARAIKCKFTCNFTLSDNTGANQGYGIVRQDGVDIYKSRRIHVGNSSGYLYNDVEEFKTTLVLPRRSFLFGLYLTNEVNAPWLNTAWEWPTTPTTTYIKLESF